MNSISELIRDGKKKRESECCRELDPVFDEMAEKALEQKKYKKYSKKYNELERDLETLHSRARNIFLKYNPDYKQGKPKWED